MSTPSTFYSGSAERRVASGLKAKADAEAFALVAKTQAEIDERKRRIEIADRAAATQAEQDRLDRVAERQARDRRHKSQRRHANLAGAGQWARRTAAAAKAKTGLLVGLIAIGAPILIAWDGQFQFGRDEMLLGAIAWALPVALEGGVWYLGWLTNRAIDQGLPTLRYRIWMWALALVAAVMNFWHAVAAFGDDGVQVGVARALCSLLGIGLWELTVSLRERAQSGRSMAEIRTAVWRWLRFPRLSWAAKSILAARGARCAIDTAWRAAWEDRFGVGPDAPRAERRLARKVIRAQAKVDRKAAKQGLLRIENGAIVRPRPAIDPQEMPVAELLDLAGAAACDSIRDYLIERAPALARAVNESRTAYASPDPASIEVRTGSPSPEPVRTEAPDPADVYLCGNACQEFWAQARIAGDADILDHITKHHSPHRSTPPIEPPHVPDAGLDRVLPAPIDRAADQDDRPPIDAGQPEPIDPPSDPEQNPIDPAQADPIDPRSKDEGGEADRPRSRSIEELKVELVELIEEGAIDPPPVSANKIMKVLKVGPPKARALRDEVNGREVVT